MNSCQVAKLHDPADSRDAARWSSPRWRQGFGMTTGEDLDDSKY